jgi:hypothetical protein
MKVIIHFEGTYPYNFRVEEQGKSKVVPLSNYLSTKSRKLLCSGATAQLFLTSALDGGEWSASRSGRFTPGGRASSTHCIGGWLGPQKQSGHCENEKNILPSPGI